MATEGRMVTPLLSSVLYLTGDAKERARQGVAYHFEQEKCPVQTSHYTIYLIMCQHRR